MDVHARSVRAAAIDTETGEVIQATVGPAVQGVLDWVEQVAVEHGPVAVTYEAGPTGYGLARALSAAGIRCEVAAPSKLIRPSGDRVKTDKKDAMLLARLLRMEEITPVRVPTQAEEDARDLVRARDDLRRDLMGTRHRLSKLLLRHGYVYDGGDAWTGKHQAWMRSQVHFELPGARAAFEQYHAQEDRLVTDRKRLDKQIAALAADSEFTATTRRLACLRGIDTLTAFALAIELGDWHRFTGATIATYLGLVPSENSSGQSQHRGAITKAGNPHARRLLIEAAWHHKASYRPGKTMHQRWALAPAQAAARGDAGNRRLHQRWQILSAHKKKHTIANTAIARELAGWCWSLAIMDT
ncbi:IS110 family transposase [Ornithinimicrobium faecis]|uniref:IS110 family transposase n=1 Tax=Ornithinimicrobium faecis TaxID=2934158 RepID=A0ABY4YZ19_9MICO|nr:IS110 family transposase [Ornithinimicrobium sp. HY1793]USQ81985.1 IS110 family transposase [Ornithinimicrobium sp. HY1793]